MVTREEGKGLARWSRALVGMLGTVAMLGGLFASLPASAGEVAPAWASTAVGAARGASRDAMAGAVDPDHGEAGKDASTAGAGLAAKKAAAVPVKAPVSGDVKKEAPGAQAGPVVSAQTGGVCAGQSAVDSGDGWCAADAGNGMYAVHVTGKAALQGKKTSSWVLDFYAEFGNLDRNNVVSVSIDNPIQLVAGDYVHLGGMQSLTKVTGLANIKGATDLSYAFEADFMLRTLDVSGLDTSQVTNMSYMFKDANALASLDVSRWDTSQVTNMSHMFDGTSLTSLEVSNWKTGKVEDMSYMFTYVSGLASLDVSRWDTSKVTNMASMFMNTAGVSSLDVSRWDTSKVTNMASMFSTAIGLMSLDVSGWDTRNVTDMSYMFTYALGLASLDVSNWKTGNVQNMSHMFDGASALASLDLSGWDTSQVTNMEYMFDNASALASLKLGPNAYFGDNAGVSSLSGRWVQVDPSAEGGACYVKDGDQASCSTVDPDQGLLRRPADGAKVRTAPVTYKRGVLVSFKYVGEDGKALASDVVSGLGLPVSKAGASDGRFSLSLPDNSVWRLKGVSSSVSSDSCAGGVLSGVYGVSDRTVTVTLARKPAGRVSFRYVGQDGKSLPVQVAGAMASRSPVKCEVDGKKSDCRAGDYFKIGPAAGYKFTGVRDLRGSTDAKVAADGKSLGVVLGTGDSELEIMVGVDPVAPVRLAGKVSFEYVDMDGKSLPVQVAAAMASRSPKDGVVGAHVSVPVAPGYLFDHADGSTGVTIKQDGRIADVVLGEQPRTVTLVVKADPAANRGSGNGVAAGASSSESGSSGLSTAAPAPASVLSKTGAVAGVAVLLSLVLLAAGGGLSVLRWTRKGKGADSSLTV